MSEPTVPRNRWRLEFVMVPLVILMVWGGTWWWFQQLNSVEKLVVGDWKLVVKSKEEARLRFRSNRTGTVFYLGDPVTEIRWSVRDKQLQLSTIAIPVHELLYEWVRSGFQDWDPTWQSSPIQVMSSDHIRIFSPDGSSTTPDSELFRTEAPP